MKRMLHLMTGLILLAAPAFAGIGDGKTFLIHAKTSLKIDDAQICAVSNVAWTALQKGHKVVILFDASGVTALKKGGLFGSDKTPLDKAALPERLQQFLLRERVDHLTFLDRLFAALNQFSSSDVLRDDCTAIVIDLHGGWDVGKA